MSEQDVIRSLKLFLEMVDEGKYDVPMWFINTVEKTVKLIGQYQKWVNDLQAGMTVNCVYCGHSYGSTKDTPISMADVLKEHIEHCPEHPMSKLKAENERLNAEVSQRNQQFSRLVINCERAPQSYNDSHRYCEKCDTMTGYRVGSEHDEEMDIEGYCITVPQKHAYCTECDNEVFLAEVVDFNVKYAHSKYVQAIREHRDSLNAEVARLTWERDALLFDVRALGCAVCKHNPQFTGMLCPHSTACAYRMHDCWEYHALYAEHGGDAEDENPNE